VGGLKRPFSLLVYAFYSVLQVLNNKTARKSLISIYFDQGIHITNHPKSGENVYPSLLYFIWSLLLESKGKLACCLVSLFSAISFISASIETINSYLHLVYFV
jgi:hypothetical protein